jgi:hypothetical protein
MCVSSVLMRQIEAYKDMLSLLIITGQIGLCVLRIFFAGKPGHLFEVSYHRIQYKQLISCFVKCLIWLKSMSAKKTLQLFM